MSGASVSNTLASELADHYVVANIVLCLVCLAVHAAVRVHTPLVAFLLFPPTAVCFGATMATHPDARVSRMGRIVVGVRMSGLDMLRTTPPWSLAVTGAFLLYIAFDFYGPRMQADSALTNEARFAASFTVICAHLAWSGVGTRIGGLRVAARRANEASA